MKNQKGKALRIGFVGTGNIADEWLAPALAIVPGAKLWSVVSRDAANAKAFAKKHGAASPKPAHASLESLLADPDLDAVIIATPDKLHAEQTVAAARAGKHVFVEKPMATSTNDAARMITACQAADVRLAVGYQNRWHAGQRFVAQFVRNEGIGAIRHMRVLWSSPAKDASGWRASGGTGRWWCMAALGPHCIDLVRWMMVPTCGETVAIRAMFSDGAFGSGRDETATIALKFNNGATADITVSVVMPPQKRMEIHGLGASIICDSTLGARGGGKISVGGRDLSFAVKNPYAGELADFVDAVRKGREPEVGGIEAAHHVTLLELAEQDARR